MRAWWLLSFLFTVLLAGCGAQSDFTTVRLVTGLEKKTSDYDLREKWFEAGRRRVVRTCTQKNLYAVVNASPGGEPILETFRIPVTLTYDDSAAYTIDGTYVRNNATFPPISVPVPRGVNVAVGILGSLVASQRTEANGTCADFSIGPPASPYSTSSVLSYRYINTTSPIDLPLSVWVLPAKTTFSPSPTPATGNPGCAPNNGDTENCITRAFMALECFFCASAPVHHVLLEYAPGRLNPIPVIQWIPGSAFTTQRVFVPNILPMKTRMFDSTMSEIPGYTKEFNRTEFTSQPGGTRSAQQTYTTAGAVAPSGETIKLIEFGRTVPPIIGGFTFAALTQPTGNILNLSWSSATNATEYAIFVNGSEYYNAGSSLNYTFNVSSLVGGTNYNIFIRARNYSQSTPVDSATSTYQHIAAFSPTYGGSPGMISATGAGAAGATNYQFIGNRTFGSGPPSFSLNSGTLPITATGLNTGDVYNIQVIATNSSSGRSESPLQSFVVP